MSLLGLAIIGKNNEPLYLCDCEEVLAHYVKSRSGSMSSDELEVDEDIETSPPVNDAFGFGSITCSKLPVDSLPLDRQWMMYAALDRIQEMLLAGSTATTNVVVGKNVGNSSTQPHWVGQLFCSDKYAVFGHVTATNLKLLALTKHPTDDEPAVRQFLAAVHSTFIRYVMNPFVDVLKQPPTIMSSTFDQGVQKAIHDFELSVSGRGTWKSTLQGFNDM